MVTKFCPNGGKIIHRTKKKAIKQAAKSAAAAVKSKDDYRTARNYYICPYCGYWHLTKQEQGE